MSTKDFVKGIFAKRHAKAPGFVVCSLSVNPEMFVDFLKKQKEQYVNMQVLMAKDGKNMYVVVDDWKPTPKEGTPSEKIVGTEEYNEQIPF